MLWSINPARTQTRQEQKVLARRVREDLVALICGPFVREGQNDKKECSAALQEENGKAAVMRTDPLEAALLSKIGECNFVFQVDGFMQGVS